MKKYYREKFAQKLINSLLTVLIIIFCLISVVVVTSFNKFLKRNAYRQSNLIATSAIVNLNHKIQEIEQIPQTIFNLYKEDIYQEQTNTIPIKVLKIFPVLHGCSIHYDKRNNLSDFSAYRMDKDSIVCSTLPSQYFKKPDSTRLLRINERKGYWIYVPFRNESMISYCELIHNDKHQNNGVLKIDFTLKMITDFIYDLKLFDSGSFFITDKNGKIITHSNDSIRMNYDLYSYVRQDGIDYSEVLDRFVKGETGDGKVFKNGKKYYIYFTKIPQMDWRLGIIFSYNEILISTSNFLIYLFIGLSLGLLILLGSVIRIVHRLSTPLKEFAAAARKVADGQFNTELPEVPSNDEIKELHDSFKYMQQNLVGYIERLKASTVENEKISTEMRLARRIQKRFLPRNNEISKNIEVFAELKQSKEVGGDLYEHFRVGNKLYFAIGDVSGKGIPAALYMASIVTLFRYVAGEHSSTAKICNIINTHMCDNSSDDMYITMFIGILNLDTGVITFTNAGHPNPMIIDADENISYLSKYPDVPVGVLDNYSYREHSYTLHTNWQLLLYTDGITDAENIDAKFYGKERLLECVKSVSVKRPQEIINAVMSDIYQHINGTGQSDDLTILAIFNKGIRTQA